jgi:signal transduction histidine kinase
MLAYHQNNITLNFAGVDLTGHFKKLQYSINSDTVWNNLVGSTLNIQLQSGSYKIQVRAIDVNNNISSKTLVIAISIATPFYLTTWFLLLIVALLTGLFVWFYTFKKLRKQKTKYEQQLAIEKERTRIIDDLHDDIGSSISSINMYSTITQQLVETDVPKAKTMLHKLSYQSQKLMENLSEIIWSMKTDNNQLMTLDTRIKTHISDVLGATEIQYIIDIEPTIDLFIHQIQVRKNIMLIIKEATNNITKYSKATNVHLALHKKNNTIILTIKDDGIGLQNKATQGNGINNIKKRTQELNGTFTITSNANEGVEIVCVFKSD